tara:strand:+ start:720 stop:1235 length:516 start_codon:yes stop_codon:yes gene_type:complete
MMRFKTFLRDLFEEKVNFPGKGDWKGLFHVSPKGKVKGVIEQGSGFDVTHDEIAMRNPKLFGLKKHKLPVSPFRLGLIISNPGTPKKPAPHNIVRVTRDGDNFGIEHHGNVPTQHVQKIAKHIFDQGVTTGKKGPRLSITSAETSEKDQFHHNYEGYEGIDRFVKYGHPKS